MSTLNLSDDLFLQQIQDCTLDPVLFDHEAMLRLSWILINKYGLDEAIIVNNNIKEQYFIKALKSDKFNRTLTRAYTEIVQHFMDKTPTNDFNKLLKEFPRLQYDFKALVKTHYGFNILKEHRKEEPKRLKQILFTF
jgi:hypothetical protein